MPHRVRTYLFPVVAGALLAFAGGCDSNKPNCPDPPSTAGPGSFALQFEEAEGCFTLQGESARFGVRSALYTDDQTVYALLVPDDGDEPTESVSFVEFLAVGEGPLPVGSYEVADLYTRSPIERAPPAGDVRLLEYPGAIALQAVVSRDEIAFSRGGTITVTRSGPDGFAGLIDAELSVQETQNGRDLPGASFRVRGAFDVQPGADPFIIVL